MIGRDEALWKAKSMCGCSTCRGGHGFRPHPEECKRAGQYADLIQRASDRDDWKAKHGEAEENTLAYVRFLHAAQAERDEIRLALERLLKAVNEADLRGAKPSPAAIDREVDRARAVLRGEKEETKC